MRGRNLECQVSLFATVIAVQCVGLLGSTLLAWADELPAQNGAIEVPLTPASTVPCVEISCLGRERRFVVDPSCTFTVVDRSLRAKLGTSLGDIKAYSDSKSGRAEVFKGSEMFLGAAKINLKYLVCADLSRVSTVADLPFDGILGLDVLEQLVVELDSDSRALRIRKDVSAETARTAERLQIARKPNGWYLKIDVGDGRFEEALLATGLHGSLVLSGELFDQLRRSDLIQDCRETIGINVLDETPSVSGRYSRLSIGRFEHENIKVAKGSNISKIGMGYLRRYNITFDFPSSCIYLSPSANFKGPEEPSDMSGMILAHKDDEIVVHTCFPNSPATDAGILKDDRIVKIGTMPASKTSLYQMRRALGCDGEQVDVVVMRDGTVLPKLVKLREFRRPARPLESQDN